MSASRAADNAQLPSFSRYSELPAEVKLTIIDEAIHELRKQLQYALQPAMPATARVKLAPFACIDEYWQTAVEDQLFNVMSIAVEDLSTFESLCTGHRRYTLSSLHINISIPASLFEWELDIDLEKLFDRFGDKDSTRFAAPAQEFVENSVVRSVNILNRLKEEDQRTKPLTLSFRVCHDFEDDQSDLQLVKEQGLKCNFSHVAPLHHVHSLKIVQDCEIWRNGEHRDQVPPDIPLRTSSLLELAAVMPNLKHLQSPLPRHPVFQESESRLSQDLAARLTSLEISPTIKVLEYDSSQSVRRSHKALSRLMFYCHLRIERLSVNCEIDLVELCRATTQMSQREGKPTWPNLRGLRLCARGYIGHTDQEEATVATLSAIVQLLVFMPKVESVSVQVNQVTGEDEADCPSEVELSFVGQGANLPFRGSRNGIRRAVLTMWAWYTTLVPEIFEAVQDVENAVREHRGLPLEIHWMSNECPGLQVWFTAQDMLADEYYSDDEEGDEGEYGESADGGELEGDECTIDVEEIEKDEYTDDDELPEEDEYTDDDQAVEGDGYTDYEKFEKYGYPHNEEFEQEW